MHYRFKKPHKYNETGKDVMNHQFYYVESSPGRPQIAMDLEVKGDNSARWHNLERWHEAKNIRIERSDDNRTIRLINDVRTFVFTVLDLDLYRAKLQPIYKKDFDNVEELYSFLHKQSLGHY